MAVREIERMAERSDADAVLICRIADGDRDAFAALYARHHLPLFRYLLGLRADRELAEEMLQDAMVAVWQSARGFRGASSARTWLFGIARRQAHNTLRRRGIPMTGMEALDATPTHEPEPEALLLTKMAYDDLLRAMDRLAAPHREVLILTFVNELSYQETAGILGVPVGTVKSRLSNARNALRALVHAEEERRS